MSDKPVNHEEALELAHLKKDESNLARAYIELAQQMKPPDDRKMNLLGEQINVILGRHHSDPGGKAIAERIWSLVVLERT